MLTRRIERRLRFIGTVRGKQFRLIECFSSEVFSVVVKQFRFSREENQKRRTKATFCGKLKLKTADRNKNKPISRVLSFSLANQ